VRTSRLLAPRAINRDMSVVVDSHQHFWQLSQPFGHGWLDAPQLKQIRRDFLPADLQTLIKQSGVDRTILVQTQHDTRENAWSLSLADENDFIAGVVGWLDLTSGDFERQLEELSQHPKFVGLRHLTQGEPDDDFIVRDDVLRGLKILEKHRIPFDLLFLVRHLRHTSTVAQMFPELPLVLDHLAKPMIKAHRFDNWEADFRKAASYPNVYCKLSGMVTEADWTAWKPADLKPYVEVALSAFGPARCMFGSDWPVCELAGAYGDVYGALRGMLDFLSDSERAEILGETAVSFYSLRV
jgi:L-fuconolactonase